MATNTVQFQLGMTACSALLLRTTKDEAMPLSRRVANAKQLNVRMPPDELKSLDVWIKTQPAPRPTRAEAIRRLVGQALAGGA